MNVIYIEHLLCVSTAAGDVQFNTAASYSLTLRLVDQNGLTDTAAVVINIIETNDPASWVGAYFPNGTAAPLATTSNTPAYQLSVSEAASVGTIFCRVLATDPNRGQVWGARIYQLVQSADTSFFAINATSGEISIGAQGAAFWDQSSFTFVVTVQDADPLIPIVVPMNVTVQLLQVNTVYISGFSVPTGTPSLQALNVSSLSTSLLYGNYAISPAVDVLLTTRGVSSLLVFGSGFGRTAARLAREGVVMTPAGIAAATPIIASLGFWSDPMSSWVATACTVIVPNNVLSCAVPPGVGANLTLSISVQGWPAVSARAVSYMPPSITGVVRQGGGGPLSTNGTDMLVVTGDNFGPLGTVPLLSYAPNATDLPLLYKNQPCVVTAAHSQLLCGTEAGVGFGLTFSVSVKSQSSAPGVFTPMPPVRYVSPSITEVSAPLLQTAGGEAGVIVLTGELMRINHVILCL